MPDSTFDWLPSLIAVPYTRSKKKGGQRKDLLRIAFENSVSLLGAMAVGDLIDIIRSMEEASEEGESSEENELFDRLQGEDADELLHDLRLIGMEQMSLGKWVALLRTLDSFCAKQKIDLTLPESLAVYGKAKKEVDELVSIRNHDAHGPAIPEDKLDDELDRRQALLEKVLAKLEFLSKWRLVQFGHFEINGDRQSYLGTEYLSTGANSIQETGLGIEVPLGEPLLLSRKGDRFIRLMPLAIVADIDGEQDTHLALFSKEIKGDPNQLGFLSWTGTSTLDVLKWSSETGVDLASRRQLFQKLFKMPEVQVPNLDATIGLEVAELVVDDQPSELKFSLANRRDSVDLESVRVLLSLPSAMSFGEAIDAGNRLDDRRVELNVDTIDCGGTYEALLPVRAVAQGSVSIPPASVGFRYRRTESSETPDADGAEETGSISLQTIDHNAEDPLCPIVNVHRSVIPADGNEEIRIGDRFQFEVTLKNVGLGRANEIETLVLVPDGLEVLDGSERIRVNLAPGGERSFRWSIRARRPGIYHIRICDVIYQDLAGRRHATECSEEFRFLVKSDKSREFRYAVQDVVADLSVTETEEEQLAGLLVGLEKAIPDADARSMLKQTAEIDAVLDIVRAAVNGVSKSKNVPVIEQVFRETKWQGKRHKDRGQRKILAFNSGEIPFFAVDYTDSTRGELFMHSFDVPGGDREPFMKADEAHSVFASNRMTKGTLDVCLPWADIRTDEKIGIGFIKGWIGRCINRLERDFKPWSEVSACFAEALGGKPMYRWYRYEISVPEPVQNDLAIRDIITPGGSYQCCGWVFRTPGKKDTFTLILNTRREIGSSCKEGTKWLRDRHEDGEHLDVNFYKPLPRTPGEAELTTRDSTWIGTEVKWSSSEAEDAVRAAADKLVDVSHQMYARATSDCDAATHRKTQVPIFVRENGESNWLDRRIPELTKARIGIRVGWRQNHQIRGSLEFFRRRSKPGAASWYSALGRIRSGGGDGELWMNWYEGMPEDLAIGNRLELDDSFWGEVEKVPKAIRLNLLLRTPPGPVDKELFDLWIDGIIAAAAARDQQTWPAFALDEILDRIFATEPRLPGIIESLAEGPVSQAELRESAGAEGKKLHSAIGRILKWGTRYHVPSPLTPALEMPDGIDINPDYRDALLARAR